MKFEGHEVKNIFSNFIFKRNVYLLQSSPNFDYTAYIYLLQLFTECLCQGTFEHEEFLFKWLLIFHIFYFLRKRKFDSLCIKNTYFLFTSHLRAGVKYMQKWCSKETETKIAFYQRDTK